MVYKDTTDYGDYKDYHVPTYNLKKMSVADYDNEMPSNYDTEKTDMNLAYLEVNPWNLFI